MNEPQNGGFLRRRNNESAYNNNDYSHQPNHRYSQKQLKALPTPKQVESSISLSSSPKQTSVITRIQSESSPTPNKQWYRITIKNSQNRTKITNKSRGES